MKSSEKLKIELNFLLDTFLCKLIRLDSCGEGEREIYAQEVRKLLQKRGEDPDHIEWITSLIERYP